MSGRIERYRELIMVVLSVVILLGVVAFLWRRPPSSQGPVLQIATAPPTSMPVPTSTPAPLRVYVSGAVAHPDVYQLPPRSIVKDALAAAGGALPDADLVRVNLAQELFDQQQVHIPLAGETPPPASNPGRLRSPSLESGCVDINGATLEDLDGLPGIGPAYSQRIIEYRSEHGPFQDVEELLQIKGIGPATLEEIRHLICAR
jgi:competence protein ComEA